MILVVRENKKEKELIKEVNFSELGIWERTDLQEWIIDCPEILGLDDDLIIITKEYDKFDKTSRRLDILAVDNNGKLVVIELKRDVADTFVDLQAIHYAAYCSTLTLEQVAEIRSEYNNESKDKNQEDILDFINKDFSDFDNQPCIILVANDFKEETLAAVLWLRDSGIDITCVKLEAYKLDEKIVITPDIIIPLPEAKNFMMQREEKIDKSKIIITEKTFFENLDQHGKNFFKELLKFGNENGLIINWGGAGFSLNVSIGNKKISLLQGYSKLKVSGQTMYSTIGSISKKVENGDEIASNYVEKTLELNVFKSVNNGFIFKLERDLEDEEWSRFKNIISETVADIKKNGLKIS